MGTSSPHISTKTSTTNIATGTNLKAKSKNKSSHQKNKLYTEALHSQSPSQKTPPSPGPASVLESVNDSLAICLLGFNSRPMNKMYDSEYEEEVRKQAVMQVSPRSNGAAT